MRLRPCTGTQRVASMALSALSLSGGQINNLGEYIGNRYEIQGNFVYAVGLNGWVTVYDITSGSEGYATSQLVPNGATAIEPSGDYFYVAGPLGITVYRVPQAILP